MDITVISSVQTQTLTLILVVVSMKHCFLDETRNHACALTY